MVSLTKKSRTVPKVNGKVAIQSIKLKISLLQKCRYMTITTLTGSVIVSSFIAKGSRNIRVSHMPKPKIRNMSLSRCELYAIHFFY